MKINKYWLSISKMSIKFKVMFIMQITIVTFLFNVIIASYNGRYMLYKPYEEALNNNGFFFTMENGVLNNEPHITTCFDNLQGEYVFFTFLTGTPRISEEQFIRIVVADDEFYNKLKLPLKKGSYNNHKDIYGMISCNKFFHTGDTISLFDYDIEISVCGEMTNPTYYPNLFYWTRNGDVRMFYEKYTLELDEIPYIIIPLSVYEKIFDKVGSIALMELGGIIYYTSPPTEEEHKHNYNVLSIEKIVEPLNNINERTIMYLNEDLYKYIPIAILALIVSLIGVVCSTAMYSVRQMKNYTVYYLCGMKWSEALDLIAANVIIMLALSMSFVITLGIIFKLTGLFSVFGFVLGINNIAITIAINIGVFILAMIIPIILIGKNSPVDLLRRNKE